MFGDKDFSEVIKEAEKMKNKMQEIQTEIDQLEITGQAGNGLVEVVINGACNCTDVKIKSSLFIETKKEMLQGLIAAAFNHAVNQLSEQKTKKIKSFSENMSLTSGLKLPF